MLGIFPDLPEAQAKAIDFFGETEQGVKKAASSRPGFDLELFNLLTLADEQTAVQDDDDFSPYDPANFIGAPL